MSFRFIGPGRSAVPPHTLLNLTGMGSWCQNIWAGGANVAMQNEPIKAQKHGLIED